MLSTGTADSLLATAESSDDDYVRLVLLTGLVHFGLDEGSWEALGDRIVDLLDVAPGTPGRPEHLELLAAVPVEAAQRRLGQLAADPSDPDWLLAVGLAGPRPEVRAAVAAHLPARLEQGTGDPHLLRAVAALPLSEYDVAPALLEPSLASDLVDSRLWASVALAKLGHLDPLRQVVDEIEADPPGFMWGDPWTAYATIAATAPLPPEAQATLVGWHHPDLGRNQAIVIGALTGRWDAENQPVAEEDEAPVPSVDAAPPPPEQETVLEELLGVVEAGDPSLLSEHADLAADLGPGPAGTLLHQLCLRAIEAQDTYETQAWGNTTMDLLGQVSSIELPVDDLVHRFADAGDSMHPGQLGAVLARTDDDTVTSVILHELADASGEDDHRLVDLLRSTAWSSRTGATPYLGAGGHRAFLPEPALLGEEPEPALLGEEPEPALLDAGPATVKPEQAADQSPTYQAYPLLEAPPVVVARQPFDVTFGLGEFYDSATTVTGPVSLPVAASPFEIEVELVVDPASLVVEGSPIATLTVTPGSRYPTHTVRVTAVTDPRLSHERTLRLFIRRDGAILGIAKRYLVVVDSPDRVATTPGPAAQDRRMLSLEPLLKEEPPDLVVGIFKTDEDTDKYLWDVYPLGARVRLAEWERRSTIDLSAKDFASYLRNQLTTEEFRGSRAFRELAGYGDLIHELMPPGVRQALRDLVAGRDTAPSVLFLTEEPYVPWELAVMRPPLSTEYGGDAPFLGAHLAMSRWPSKDRDAPPAPAPRLGVRQPGVLTARYEGIENWPRLEAAEAEAEEFVRDNPGTLTIQPRVEDVVACLEGTTPVDLLHVALHGQVDPTYGEDGLVLLEPDGDGYKVAYLTTYAVRGLRENQTTTPFVFLNACQVGAGDRVLGSYTGLAATVLRTGACGVVAPLWNIDDTVAAKLSGRFYDAAFAPDAVPVAEVLRRIRAEYTLAAVQADPAGITPTYVAYQFFGHPRLVLQRPGG